MTWRMLALALAFPTILAAWDRPAAGGSIGTPVQTQSIPMTSTNWGPGTDGLSDPLAFRQFDPGLGTLDAVAVTMSATIQNNFTLTFFATPIPSTLYIATTETTDPSVLANPSLAAQLTDGPSVTLTGPDGVTPIFSGPGTTLPVDVVSLNEPSGTWSSTLPITDPNYIAPDDVTLSLSSTIDASNDAAMLAQFIGTGTVDLPVSAIAHSSFYSDSGNGSGSVVTSASATVTIQYFYTPPSIASVPEPSGLILLGAGAVISLLAAGSGRRRRRRPPSAGGDRGREMAKGSIED